MSSKKATPVKQSKKRTSKFPPVSYLRALQIIVLLQNILRVSTPASHSFTYSYCELCLYSC